jgi:glycosyltransferase involved in cell wall biosynthesis
MLQQNGLRNMTVRRPILFYDQNSPAPYDYESLLKKSLGGVEASIIRIAEKLGEVTPVVVAMKNRTTISSSKNVHYMPITPFLLTLDWHAVIALRSLSSAFEIRSANPKVPIWIWFHDFIKIDLFPHLKEMLEQKIGAIVISDYQQKQLTDLFLLDPYFKNPPEFHRIYNPIDDSLVADATRVDPYKLLFSSSPHKGLKETLEGFREVRKKDSGFRLYVTNPGYFRPEIPAQEGVIFLTLNHQENIQLMRESLTLFQLNSVYPETFGLVLAEANSVGTPILTHPLGSAPEILTKEQLIDTTDTEMVIERILQWHQKRPQVKLEDKFRLSYVIQEWIKLLKI